MEEENGMAKENRYELNKELAQMLKGGVIMDVTTPEQAKIAENTSERLAKIFCSADKRYFKFMFVDVIYIICRGKHFALIDVVDLDRL